MAEVDDMDRANSIVEWSVETGRDPFDTAGIGTSDEEWMGENPNWDDYIQSEVIERKMNKQVEKQKKKPTAKTAKKSTSKFNYPPEYLKKDGTLKKAYKKKAAQFRKEQTKTRSKSRSKSRSPRSPEPIEDTSDEAFRDRHRPLENLERRGYLVDEKATRRYRTPTSSVRHDPRSQFNDIFEGAMNRIDRRSSPAQDDSVEDIGFNDLPQEIDDKLLDEHVFQGDTDRRMDIERCRRLREFCTLYPRTCAFDEDFKRRYIKPCVSRYNIQDVKGRKNQAYSDVMDYKGAVNPQVRSQADVYSDRTRFFNRPDYSSIPRYIEGIDRNVHNPSGSVFKKHGRDALMRSIMEGKTGPGSIRYSGRQSMLQLKKDVMRYPSVLDDILGTFRINAREKGYSDKAINDMVRKFIDHLYLD